MTGPKVWRPVCPSSSAPARAASSPAGWATGPKQGRPGPRPLEDGQSGRILAGLAIGLGSVYCADIDTGERYPPQEFPMRLTVRCFVLSTFLLLPFTVSCHSAVSVQLPGGWTTHNDPAGFSVDIPAGWVVTADSTQGRIKLRGTRGEQVVIWPIFIEKRQLNADGAARLVMQLARRLDSSLSWTPANASGNVARVATKGASS